MIGVEGAQLGIEQFFQEHHIEYTIEPADSIKGHLYQVHVLMSVIYMYITATYINLHGSSAHKYVIYVILRCCVEKNMANKKRNICFM